MYTVKSVSDLTEALALMRAYSNEHNVYNPFIRPAWLEAWVRHCAPKGRPEVLFLCDDTGRVVGYAPLWRRESSLGTLYYSLMGDGMANLLDIAYSIPIEDACSAIERHFQASGKPTILRLNDIDVRSPLAEALSRRHDVTSVYLYDCPFVEMPEGFDRFFRQRLNSKRRRELLRLEGRLKELGRVEIVTITDESSLREWHGRLDEIFGLHRERFAKVINTSGFSNPRYRRFYEDLLSNTASDHSLFLSLLLLDNHVVSFVLGFRSGEKIVDCIPAFAPALGAFSLGHLHLYHILKSLPDLGVTVFDFSKGNATYKSKWATGSSGNVCFWWAFNMRPVDIVRYRGLVAQERLRAYYRARGTTATIKRILGRFGAFMTKVKSRPHRQLWVPLDKVPTGPLRYGTLVQLHPAIQENVIRAVARGAHAVVDAGIIRLNWDDGRANTIRCDSIS